MLLARICGAAIAALVAFPVYRLLQEREIGIMGADVLLGAEQDRALMLSGAPILLVLGFIIARVVGTRRIEGLAARIGQMLTAIPAGRFAAGLGVIAAVYTGLFSLWILDGKPNLIDSMAQLLHARFIAAGALAGPVDGWNEFWHVQNSVVTPRGWVSQYPPGHVLLLAAGFRAGAVWVVGPILCGVTVFFTALAAERLLPDDRAVARLGAVFAAASPFFVAHAGAYMNHVSAAAMCTGAIYFAARARDETAIKWPLLAGLATGAAFTIRPLAALATAVTAAVILANPSRAGTASRRGWLRASLLACMGAFPFVAALAAYNSMFFGSALRFGYTAAWGDATGLGFHRDSWGNMYGPAEAIGFTSSDLTSLSLHLLGTPIPVVLVVGLFLVLARTLTAGQRLIALWALLPVGANALYWHHGMFMGPRMLNEAAPAWALLAGVAAVGLVRTVPPSWEAREYSLRSGLAVAFTLAALAGILYLGPDRLGQYGRAWMASSRIEVPQVPTRALVFVHGGWTGRIAMRLASRGMRLDSVETALRLNPTCDVHRFASRYPAPASPAFRERPVDFTPKAGELRPRIAVSRGNYIRLKQGDQLSADCRREVASDTLGIVDVAPLLWQGDVPGAPRSGALIVRDMGPAANSRLIAVHRDRVPLMFMRRSDDEDPVLLPYATAVSLLWPDAALTAR